MAKKIFLPPPPSKVAITRNNLPTDALIRYFLDIAGASGILDEGIAELEIRVTKNEEDIVALDGRVTQNENDIVTLDARLVTVEGEIVTIKARLDTVEQSVTDLTVRVGDNETAIADHETRISTIESAGYITDAPHDGKLYGRQDGNWVEIV